MKKVVLRIVSLPLACLLADPSLAATLSQQHSFAGNLTFLQTASFDDQALSAPANVFRHPKSFTSNAGMVVAVLVIGSTAVFAATSSTGLPSYSTLLLAPQAIRDPSTKFFENYLWMGFQWQVVERLYAYWSSTWGVKTEMSEPNKRLSRLLVVIAGYSLTSGLLGLFPDRLLWSNAIILFFKNHDLLSVLLDETLVFLMGLAIWQKLSLKGWPRVNIELPNSLEESFDMFHTLRGTGVINWVALGYGFFQMGKDILFFLPVWGMVTIIFREVDRRWFARFIKRHLEKTANMRAVTFDGHLAPTSLVFWEKEPDFLRWGGLLLPWPEYVVHLSEWRALHKRVFGFFRNILSQMAPQMAPQQAFALSHQSA